MQPPQYFRLHPSRWQQRLLVLLLVLSGALLLAYPAHLLLRVFALVALGLWGRRLVRRAALGNGPEILTLEITGDGGFALQCSASGGFLAARRLPVLTVHPWLTVLRLELLASRQRRTLVLTPDRMSGDEFRRLRVALRWRHELSASGEAA